ncbi:hypothetical protein CBR_g8013 [Chara braunii]|uniref:Retrotransposon gag domain-containing protein n=1 Tax=Chara braunii TaxID=69332 RepID=A0A388KKZ1_CHABU|nr:hypothetical protein CBR_g8013 [Chara braunii]|eukprot:GBG70714.1 hypothetical protein CBR_g8013 [Chara braunii]
MPIADANGAPPRVMVNIPATFPIYPNYTHPDAWLEAVQAQGYGAEDLPRVITLLLRNTSHDWFRRHRWVDWDTFKRAFLARFDAVSENDAWFVLKTRPQEPGELLPDFVDRFQTALDKSGREEKEARDLFIDHLCNPVLKAKLQKKFPPKTNQQSVIIAKALQLDLLDTLRCHWSRYYSNRELEHTHEISMLLAQMWPNESATDGTLVGLLCGEIAKGGRATVAYELLTFLSQLIDDLPTDIISYNPSDPKQTAPETLERKLTPTVIWANCTEDYGQYLSDHDPTAWCYLDLDELAPDNSDFNEFWQAHWENGELPSDDDPGRIAIAGLLEEEEPEARSTSKEEGEASTPEHREASQAPPLAQGGSALNPAVPSDAASRHDGAPTSRRRRRPRSPSPAASAPSALRPHPPPGPDIPSSSCLPPPS